MEEGLFKTDAVSEEEETAGERGNGNFTCVRSSLFVNALVSAVVAEQVPIDTNISRDHSGP